jgi:hypothetical protein
LLRGLRDMVTENLRNLQHTRSEIPAATTFCFLYVKT